MIQTRYKIVSTRLFFVLCLLLLPLVAVLGHPSSAIGQSEPVELRLAATGVDNLPKVTLQLYAIDRAGSRAELRNLPLTVTHGNEVVQNVSVNNEVDVGTYTIILVDTAAGVQELIPAMKEAIAIFVENGYMQEPTDQLAIFQVGASKAEPLLEPTQFLNSVRNFLVDDLPVELGSTALYDSVNDLLDNIDAAKPDPAMATSIVVFSDGTDAVSTSIDRDALIAKAAESDVQIHTVLLENPFLSDSQIQVGGLFLKELSFGTNGISTGLNLEGIEALWRSISSFHFHTIVEYEPNILQAETVPILVSFADFPEIEVGTLIDVPGGSMLIDIPIPLDQNELIISDVTEPLELLIPVEVSWLGNQSEGVTSVQIWQGDQLLADPIDLEQQARYFIPITLDGLSYGTTEIYATASDTRGRRGESAAYTFIVSPGEETVIPELISVESPGVRWTWWLGLISIPLLVIGLGYWLFSQGNTLEIPVNVLDWLNGLSRPKRSRRSRQIERSTLDEYEVQSGAAPPDAFQAVDQYQGYADPAYASSPSQSAAGYGDEQDEIGPETTKYWFEMIQASQGSLRAMPLMAMEHRLGRSPNQADINFPNEPTISRLHASIAKELDAYRLYDEQSTSGTFVNGVPVPEYGTLLIDGDEIQIGEVVLRYHCLS